MSTDCEGWWLSGFRNSVAEHWLHKLGVLVSIPSDCQPFHLPLFLSQSILNYFILSLHQGFTLYEAAKQGNVDKVKFFVDKGADTNTRDAIGVSMLLC